jgi:hypothetical protein
MVESQFLILLPTVKLATSCRNNAHAQRRGQNYPQPLIGPPSRKPPRSPRPVTVGEGITPPVSASEPCMRVSTSHGSSVICPLSWAPLRACALHVRASPSRVIHTSLSGVLTASAALLIPITCIAPSPRRHIRWLSQRPWLLGESPTMPDPVDTCSVREPDTGLLRSQSPFIAERRTPLFAGFLGGVSESAADPLSP